MDGGIYKYTITIQHDFMIIIIITGEVVVLLRSPVCVVFIAAFKCPPL